MNYFIYLALGYLILVVIVQCDNSHIKLKTACWNTFAGPIIYLVLYPAFVVAHTYISVRVRVYYFLQNYKHAHQNSNPS